MMKPDGRESLPQATAKNWQSRRDINDVHLPLAFPLETSSSTLVPRPKAWRSGDRQEIWTFESGCCRMNQITDRTAEDREESSPRMRNRLGAPNGRFDMKEAVLRYERGGSMSEASSKRVFIGSCLFLLLVLSFFYGFVAGAFGIWPGNMFFKAKEIAQSLIRYKRIAPKDLFCKAAEDSPRQRIKIYRESQMQKGFYAFLGWDERSKTYAAWLYDDEGNLLHTWPIDYYSLDPDGPSNNSDTPHAFKVLADRSILVGFDSGDILARLDPDGNAIWVKEGIFHHSLEEADDGSFWAWRGPGTAYGHHNYLVNLDPATGSTLKEISLVDDIIKNNDATASIVFNTRRSFHFQNFEKTPPDKRDSDRYHPNDIEALSSGLADRFPEFNAGDLLLSFRTLNLIAVLDPGSYELKWWSHGPWRYQHDPDFTDDGKISVYNNNSSFGRSEIVKIDPTTMELSNELLDGEVCFYSYAMGKHQYLPNGNVLIVVSGEGRVIVVTKDGNKVMEFNNIVEDLDRVNGHVCNGMWVPVDFFETNPVNSRNQTHKEG
jgi:hypothetical protein